jgi:asparagine synthase (glutamine-hydrolysing)
MSAILGAINLDNGAESLAAGVIAMASTCRRIAHGGMPILTTRSAAMAAFDGLVAAECHRDGTLLVAIQGEVRFAAPELTRHAEQFGAAAAVGHAWSLYGHDCVRHMHGAFAVAIAAVAAHPAVGRRLDRQGLYNYLYCENVPAPGTIFQGVSKLLPGQRVIVEGGQARLDFYWRLEYRDGGAERDDALAAEFRRLLRDCIGRASAGGDAGTFLSGGTDSSTVTGILTELRGAAVDTYSIGFEADGYDEMDYARISARHFGSRAHEHYVTPADVAGAIDLIASAYDEPFGNASAVPTYYCAKLAKDDGRGLLLAGDGGDELFGGNARYAKQKVFEAYWRLPSMLRGGLVEPLLFSGAWSGRLPLLRKARSYVQQARIPLPDRLETYNFLEREVLAEIFEPEFLAAVDPHQPRDIAREVFHRTSSRSAVDRMMHLDLKETLADNDLRKVNGMCELAGIRVRYPLLDDDLVAFSGRLTPAQKVRGLRLRHFFKEALQGFLPPQTIAKTKHGFGLPFGVWMARDAALRDMAVESLRSFKSRGIVRESYVERLLRLHEASHAGYYGVMIWIVMMLERWLAAQEQRGPAAGDQTPAGANMPCARV